jgi:phenylpropionate dioxygenase-like ring-hydroxylating dioxygenase large terminal subunit
LHARGTDPPEVCSLHAIDAIDAPVRIPRERYTSSRFAALEHERLWPHAWLIACSSDHVAEPGDFHEFRCGPMSVVIVRDEAGVLQAFQNVCRHRGNTLCEGSGTGLQELRCRYHRWTWDLQGRLREVPSRRWFGELRNDEFPLFGARVAEWGRLVWVNLDLDAVPLDEWLEAVPDDVAWARLDEFRCAAMTTTPVACNWKVVNEGFSETYHVQGLHREMLASMDDLHSPQQLWGLHGASYQPYGVPSPRLGENVSGTDVWESFVVTQGGRMGPDCAENRHGMPAPPVLVDGETMQDAIARRIREYQQSLGVDLSRFDTREITHLWQYNLFPNATLLVNADLYAVLTARPRRAYDEAELVILYFTRAPSAGAPRSTPLNAALPPENGYHGHVFDQDVSVLAGMQRGLEQPGLDEIVLSTEECRIVNMHRNLERFLGVEPGGRVDGA